MFSFSHGGPGGPGRYFRRDHLLSRTSRENQDKGNSDRSEGWQENEKAPQDSSPSSNLKNRQPFAFLKFEFSQVLSAQMIQLSYIDLFDQGVDLTDIKSREQHSLVTLAKVDTIKNPNGLSPNEENVFNLLVSDLEFKWLDRAFQWAHMSILLYEFSSPCFIHAYELFTANDEPGRDPISWKVYGKEKVHHNWTLVDVRKGINPPSDRFRGYGAFVLNFGSETLSGGVHVNASNLVNLGYIDKVKLSRLSSQETIEYWEKINVNRCLEYDEVLSSICVRQEWMSFSMLGTCLKYLDACLKERPLKVPFEVELTKSIKFSYPRQNVISVRCCLGGYPLYSNIMNLYQYIGSERQQPLQAALRQVRETDDVSGMVAILSLLARGGGECHARKLEAHNTLVQKAYFLRHKSLHSEQISSFSLSPNKSNYSRSWTENLDPVAKATRVVLDCLLDFLEDYKVRAFKSSFLEPSKLFFKLIRDHTMEGDVDIHGSQTYACLLLSTLNIKLGISPHQHDGVKGCIAFLEVRKELENYLNEIWNPSKIGVALNAVSPQCRDPSLPYEVLRKLYSVPNQRFIYPDQVVRQVAHAAVDPSKKNEKMRRKVAEYLKIYARYFSEEIFLQRAIMHLVSNEGRPDDFKVVFQHFKKISIGNGEKDERLSAATIPDEWLYDEEKDYEFIPSNAYRLLKFVGLLKEK